MLVRIRHPEKLKQWEEANVPPQVAIEILSTSRAAGCGGTERDFVLRATMADSTMGRRNASDGGVGRGTYVGAFLSGAGEGAVNIVTGARDAVVEVGRTGRDVVAIYSDWNNVDPSRLESKLFQGAAQTAGNPAAAASCDRQLVVDTPELAIAYTPVDYPHAPKPDLLATPPKK